MTALRASPLVLFVAGEPDTGPDPLRDVDTSVWSRFAGVFVGGAVVGHFTGASGGKGAPRPLAEGQVHWHLSREQNQCVELVLQVAQREGRTVQLVDVNLAGDDQSLVDRWVGPDDLLPILVRPDGDRLTGLEEFVPGRVRRFIRES